MKVKANILIDNHYIFSVYLVGMPLNVGFKPVTGTNFGE